VFVRAIFIITRYSVLSQGIGVRIRRSATSFDDYKQKLFSDERLASRLAGFRSIAIASIASQRGCSLPIYFLVVTSSELPAQALVNLRSELDHINSDAVRVRLVFVSVNGDEHPASYLYSDFSKAVSETIRREAGSSDELIYASVRLDDDDGLASDYCQELSKYIRAGTVGFPIIFPLGLQGFFASSTGSIKDVRRFYHLNISPGMAFINRYTSKSGFDCDKVSVYSLGDHSKVCSTYPVIMDARKVAFFRTFASFNDSGTGYYTKFLPKIAESDLENFEFVKRLWVNRSRTDMADYSIDEFDNISALKQIVVLRNWWAIRLQKIIRQLRWFFRLRRS
jgi:hypothetical protein